MFAVARVPVGDTPGEVDPSTGTSGRCPPSICPRVRGHGQRGATRPRAVVPLRGSGQRARTNHVKPELAWTGIAGRPPPTGTHGDPRARPGCARADRRATSARVRQGPAAQGTRTRRSVPDLPTPGGASRRPPTGPRLAPA